MKLVIDVQGFKIENNKFIVKELAAYDGIRLCHYVFKPPFAMKLLSPNLQKQALWLMNNHHCLDWHFGFTPFYLFSDIIKNLTSKVECVYVKGREKADYIRKYSMNSVYELAESSKLQVGQTRCLYHTKESCICALTNVFYLYDNFLMDEQ